MDKYYRVVYHICQFGTGGHTQKARPVEVLTHSQGNLEAKGNLEVLLKTLPPVCMVYTARGESQVANIARGEAECYICHETLTKSCIYHTNEAAVL